MNPNMPYDSNALKNMVSRVKTYCSHIIPLVFDNTLSYYETLCAFCGKLNELCDAVNAQNLTIAEFTHMVEVEISKFEEYMQGELTSLKDDMEDAKSDITSILNELSNDIRPALTQLQDDVNSLQSDLAEKVGWNDVVYSVLENNDHPVTSGAVYDAIQESGGGGGFVPDATTSSKGIVQVGENLNVNAGVLSIPNATSASKGVVQVGENLDVHDGVIDVPRATGIDLGIVMPGVGLNISSVQHGVLNLTTATDQRLGGVKAGDNINYENDGTINVPIATQNACGVVQAGNHMTIDANGNLSVQTATPDNLGLVTIDGTDSCLSLSAGKLDAKPATHEHNGVVKATGGETNVTVGRDGTLNVYTASTARRGCVKIGDNIDVVEDLTTDAGTISVKTATKNDKGVVQIGDRLSVSSGVVDVPLASQYNVGVVAPKLGGSITVDSSGGMDVNNATTLAKGVVQLTDTITDGDTTHVPTADAVYDAITGQTPPQIADATTSSKGIVQIGDNINVSSGEISVPNASANTSGVVKVDSSTPLYMNTQTNTLNIKDGSTTAKGALQVGNNLSVTDGVVSVPVGTNSQMGVVTAGTNTSIVNGEVRVADASTSNKGVVQTATTIDSQSTNFTVPTTATVYSALQNVTPPVATSSTNGIVHTGDNISVDVSGALSVPVAGASTKGVVNIGDNIDVSASGEISVPKTDAYTYGVMKTGQGLLSSSGIVTLDSATASVRGGVKIGDNVDVDNTGTISVPMATGNSLGVVKPGANTAVDANGALYVPNASIYQPGAVQLDSSVTAGSSNVPTSDAVYNAVSSVAPSVATTSSAGIVQLDSTVTQGSTNVPTSGAVYSAISGLSIPSIIKSSDVTNISYTNVSGGISNLTYEGKNFNNNAIWLQAQANITANSSYAFVTNLTIPNINLRNKIIIPIHQNASVSYLNMETYIHSVDTTNGVLRLQHAGRTYDGESSVIITYAFVLIIT